MTPQQLRNRTKSFAVAILRLSRQLPTTEESRIIGRQLLRAGMSVGASYRAVCRARSDAEFAAKLATVIEECDETGYWLDVLVEAGLCAPAALLSSQAEAEELLRIMVSCRETVRRRLRLRRAPSQITNHRSQIR
jgi:four helix bundle protein